MILNVQVIDRFEGEYAFLSNFYPSEIVFLKTKIPTVEHGYQMAKCLNLKDRIAIANASTPGKAKRMGQLVELRPDWESVKDKFMYKLLMRKFAIPELQSKLIATKDALLVEGNDWGDQYWGRTAAGGLNRLGVLLCEVRYQYITGKVLHPNFTKNNMYESKS